MHNYRQISLFPYSYNLFTKIIENRQTNKLDSYPSVEQEWFRRVYSIIEQIQRIRLLIQKCNENNVPLHLAFIEHRKASDPMEVVGDI